MPIGLTSGLNCIKRIRHIIHIPAIGDIRLKALKANNIQEIINKNIQEGHHRTAELIRLTMQQIIRQAVIEGFIYKDISLGISLPPKPHSQKRALTDAEKKLILAAPLSPKERTFINILYYTGVRRGEALALTKGDIDFINKTISINKNLVMKNNESVIKPSPKTNAGIRELPIPEKLYDTLKNYVSSLTSQYLFTKNDGELMSRSAFRRFWDNILDQINIAAGGTRYTRTDRKTDTENPMQLIADDITPHLFRHTYATTLYYAGIDIKTAQYLLGHSSIQMTMDLYTHLDSGKILNSKDKLDAFF